MLTTRRRLLGQFALGAAGAALSGVTVRAQDAFPTRQITIVVPFSPGGTADVLARAIAARLRTKYNQPVVVENRPGAGGTIAAAAVAREKPDGYTLFLAEVGPNAVSHTLTTKLPYDPHTAFTPIIHLANLPAVVLIRPTLSYATLADYVAAARQQPGKFNYASAGLGNWTHLFMAYLNSQAGIDVVNILYRSGAEMLTALLRNDADTAIITLSTALGQIKEGKLRALAGVSLRPMPQLPDVPPVARTIPGFDVSVWHGIAGPAGMDPALVTRINAIFNQVLQLPAVRTAIAEAQAAEIVGGSPQQFDRFIKSELQRWPQVVKAAGIKPE